MVKSVFFNSKFKSKSKNQSSNNQLDDRPAKKHCNSRSKFKNQPDQSETMTTGLVTVNRSAESPDDSSEPPSSPSIVIEDSPQPVNTRQPTRQTATDPTTAVTTNTNRTRSDSSRSQASGSTNQIQTSNNRNQIFNTQLTVYRKKTPLLKSVKRHATILMRAYRIKQILSQPTVLNLPRNILPSDNVLQLSQEIAEKVSLQIFRKEVSKVNCKASSEN
ncbi:hypothetical protein BY996DRAFT_3842820 [Phakopsora pachyrhizi]|nr:hypothetical protein BY996DRAFT_3842820 [Phakopsora pachyrhizi]